MMDIELEIRDYLLKKIIRHEFAQGKKLPSENDTARKFKTTRHTVRKAYQMLEEMGYLYAQQGIGHFPLPPKPEIELHLRGDIGFSQKMREQGIPYESRNLSIRLVSEPDKYHKKGLRANIYEVNRIRYLYGKPAALHRSYISEETFPNIKETGRHISSMFDYYRELGYQSFESSGTQMSISFPTIEEKEILQCGSLVPLLILDTNCFDKKSGKLLELTNIIYRSDLFKYNLQKN